MRFICVNGNRGKRLEILENRRLHKRISYFIHKKNEHKIPCHGLKHELCPTY